MTTDAPYYEVRGNRTFTIRSCDDEDGAARDDDEAIAIAENIAYVWGESVTVLRDGKPICQVLPDRGF